MSAKEKIVEIRKKLSSMSEEDRQQFVSRVGAIVTVDGRPLSGRNTELVLFQNGNATIVGGFQQWRKSGRQVRKGEHGMAIWVPAISKAREAQAESEDDLYFFGATVFDISQTDKMEEVDG